VDDRERRLRLIDEQRREAEARMPRRRSDGPLFDASRTGPESTGTWRADVPARRPSAAKAGFLFGLGFGAGTALVRVLLALVGWVLVLILLWGGLSAFGVF
jgi:fatty acid desaturase